MPFDFHDFDRKMCIRDSGQDGENCFCRRRDLITAKIRREQPDIICFQEVLDVYKRQPRGMHVILKLKVRERETDEESNAGGG